MRRLLFALSLGIALVVGTTTTAFAGETFVLHDHEDGGAAPPLYGLRLDGLYNGDSSDVYTFSFDDTASNMILRVTGSGATTKITISGTVYGGLNDNSTTSGYAETGTDADKVGVWEVFFEYDTNVAGVTSPDGWKVTADSTSNEGWIRRIGDKDRIALAGGPEAEFDLTDEDGTHGYSFKFLDTVHRGDGPWSGWGWLNHDWDRDGTIDPHVYASDWLFTATPVPEPGTAILLGMGLAGVVAVRRRRSRV